MIRRSYLRLPCTVATLALIPCARLAYCESATMAHLRDEYRGKTVIVRGFYSGNRLRYDSAGAVADAAEAEDWTDSGFVMVREMRSSHGRLEIDAERLLVIEADGKQFEFLEERDRVKNDVKIEADLDAGRVTPEQADAYMAKIFLTRQDRLADLVADYWRPCVSAAGSGLPLKYQFAPELLAVPGVSGGASGSESAERNGGLDCTMHPAHRRSDRPPRAIYDPPPQFSEHARQAKMQGIVILTLVVDEKGMPQHVRVTRPLGGGLDEQAVACVKQWRFNPSEKEGEPVAAEIAVEVNFHLY